jgi:SAM-dependent methyltransferase
MPFSPNYFDSMFLASDDPWQFKTRWYEARKRSMLLACLPQRRYASAFEPGCANGELSVDLSQRCDQLLIADCSKVALDIAKTRAANLKNVSAVHATLPEEWPAGIFDLVVISELGYYFGSDALAKLSRKIEASLTPAGTLLACHWRKRIEGCDFDGAEVNDFLHQQLRWPKLVCVEDADFIMTIWSPCPATVAQRESMG